MATVRMVKGTKYADIFDSPEMIAGAKADGYELVSEKPQAESKVVSADEKSDEKTEKTPKSKRQ